MNKPTKKDRLREKTRTDIERSRQTTFDSLPNTCKEDWAKPNAQTEKQIEILEVSAETREDELRLEVAFRLLPSKTYFSKLTGELHFDGQLFHTVALSIPQSPLAGNEFEFKSVLDMTGISPGAHTIRVGMYEKWSSGEKLTATSKEKPFDYVPVKREDRYIEIPTVKSVAGADLAVISEAEKQIFRETEENLKREQISKRDDW